jgi:hypothetical protein
MPDTSTEIALATTTLSSAASSITFSSISGAYTDLRLVIVGRTTASSSIAIQLNGDTATNYSYSYLGGDGTSTFRGRNQDITRIQCYENFNSSTPTALEIDIFSYTGSTYKTMLITQSADRNGSGSVMKEVAMWRSTSAVTQFQIYAQSSDTLMAGTTATLYGIL